MEYALITGGSRGIGRAVCLQMATQGFQVLINYTRNEKAAKITKEEVENLGCKAELLPFDVSDRVATREAIAAWHQSHPEDFISTLVNNAGIKKDNLLLWMKDEEWDGVVDISLGGFYNVTKEILPEMVKHKKGYVVNVVSLSGLKGLPGQTNYSAAKAAVIGATKALAQEVARRNITVNAVAPGFIKTDMTEAIDEKDFVAMIPMRRFGQAEEVARVVGFLASPAASYITGEVISVNGGIY